MNKFRFAFLVLLLVAVSGLVAISSVTAFAEATGGKIVTPHDEAIITSVETVLVRVVTYPGRLEDWQSVKCCAMTLIEKFPLTLIEQHGNMIVFEWNPNSTGQFILSASVETSDGEVSFGNIRVTVLPGIKMD